MNIRKFVVRATHLEDLVQLGTLTGQAARFLDAAVASGLNVLVAGGTQVGKPTLPPGGRPSDGRGCSTGSVTTLAGTLDAA